jgi:hypothetical protein
MDAIFAVCATKKNREDRKNGLTFYCEYRNYRLMHLEPAKSIIERCGGPEVVAARTNRDPSRVYRWMHPKDKGGTGGTIPFQLVPTLIAVAAERGIALTADDFLPPTSVPTEAA